MSEGHAPIDVISIAVDNKFLKNETRDHPIKQIHILIFYFCGPRCLVHGPRCQ